MHRERKDNFKNDREVKRLKECELALREEIIFLHFLQTSDSKDQKHDVVLNLHPYLLNVMHKLMFIYLYNPIMN